MPRLVRPPRMVRRKPLVERLRALLNPMDFLLWLSEELETRDWDSTLVGTQLGLALNFALLLARANSGSSSSGDDIFRDESSGGWLSFLIHPLVLGLALFSFTNAFYMFTRTRKYRLFEANVEVKPATPSVRRVKVQSSPVGNSPLRFIADMISPDSADSRAHPDKTKDVWELSVWDPLPISLRIFCFLSPGHVLVYLMFLPLAPLDPRPSVTVFNTMVLQVLLSAQLIFIMTRFAQQAKDNAIVQKEVLHEYDTKFVHPRLHPVVRDVGVQFPDPSDGHGSVEIGTPTTVIKRSFHTNPNPNYVSHVDPDDGAPSGHTNVMRPQMFTPTVASRRSNMFTPRLSQPQSASRQSLPSAYTPSAPGTAIASTSTDFGGNMGIHSHHKSPLKKTISLNDMHESQVPSSPRNSREMAAFEQRQERSAARQSSPSKGSPNVWAAMPHIRDISNPTGDMRRKAGERYPSRW